MRTHFKECPHFRIVRDRLWEVTLRGLYYSNKLDRWFVIPEGFLTDFGSVYCIPGAAFLYTARAMEASVLHDLLYTFGPEWGVSREEADEEFFQAMIATDKAWWIKYPMWFGVRIGGWRYYGRGRHGEKGDSRSGSDDDRLRMEHDAGPIDGGG